MFCVHIYCLGGELDGETFVLGPFPNEDRAQVHADGFSPEQYDVTVMPLHADREAADLP